MDEVTASPTGRARRRRPRRWLRWVVRGLLAVFALVVVLAIGGVIWLRGSLPQTDGRIAVDGLAAPASIVRDADGLVTIRADSETDAAFALGYAHAQDRLFQMELMRRIGAGRLAEVVGSRGLPLDRRMRLLGFYRLAEASFAHLSPEVQAALEAYSAGVNAFLATRTGPLPVEFVMLQHDPEPWRPADSLVWGRLMALQLSDNWAGEALRYRLAARLDGPLLDSLWPTEADGQSSLLDGVLPTLAWRGAGDGLRPLTEAGGSNNWVLDGTRTESGKPLLANDPHLALSIPIQWYLARIETPDRTIVGGTSPGVPFVLIGHNERVAWGFTTTHSDTQDLFVERLAEGDPTRYQAPGGTEPFVTREEIIKVNGEEDVRLTVRSTRHGVVVSDLGGMTAAGAADEVLALAWPGLAEDDVTAQAIYKIGRSDTAEEVIEALRDFGAPQQNIVFADTAGAIGFVAAGRVPVRKAVFAGSQMPAPGWSGDHDWTGWLPFEELPQVHRPPSGRIITANDDIRPPGYVPFLGARWGTPYRARRIADRLDETDQHSVLTMASIQADIVSLAARSVVAPLLAAAGTEVNHPLGRPALTLLRGWDYRMDRDRPEPLIYAAWLNRIAHRIAADELGDLFYELWVWDVEDLRRLLAGEFPEAALWCDDETTAAETEDCTFQVRRALAEALEALRQAYGDEIAGWRWGAAHQARFAHPIFGGIPLLGDLTGTEIEVGGDEHTVNRAGSVLQADAASFADVHGAGMRAIFDFADLDASRFIIATGQSGNPFSSHYGDMVRRWRDGSYVMLPGGEGSPADQTLVLEPK